MVPSSSAPSGPACRAVIVESTAATSSRDDDATSQCCASEPHVRGNASRVSGVEVQRRITDRRDVECAGHATSVARNTRPTSRRSDDERKGADPRWNCPSVRTTPRAAECDDARLPRLRNGDTRSRGDGLRTDPRWITTRCCDRCRVCAASRGFGDGQYDTASDKDHQRRKKSKNPKLGYASRTKSPPHTRSMAQRRNVL